MLTIRRIRDLHRVRVVSMGVALAWVFLTSLSSFAQVPKKGNAPPEVPKAVTQVLAQHGLSIVGTNLVLDQDSKVQKGLNKLTESKKDLWTANKALSIAEAEVARIKEEISGHRRYQTQLNAQLANVQDVLTNNRIVGELNKTAGIIQFQVGEQKKADENVTKARGEVFQIESDIIKSLAELRELSDKAREKWESLKTEKTVVAAVEAATKHLGQEVALKPSAKVEMVERKLNDLEKSVISESIALEDREGSYWIDVAINQNAAEKMILDTGATVISVPMALANKLNVTPQPSDPDVVVSLADGSQIPGKLVILKSVRVGKFLVNDVECVVLGEQATDVRPLLGMSFLGKFKFAMNAGDSELKLVQVDSGEPEPSPSKLKKKSK
jgi:clan AA aspartic protease (TIGR02281 family)